MFRFINKIFN